MRNLELVLESTRRNEALCITFASCLHALLFLINPIILKSGWHPPHDFVTVDLVDQPAPGSYVQPAAPRKMTLMETIKDMLRTPKTEDIGHIAPRPVAPPAAAPNQPLLKDISRRPITPSFQPRSQTEDLAALKAPDAIGPTVGKVAPLPMTNGPSLKTKSFGGIRAKDLPFQVSGGQDSLTGGPSTIPIAVGHNTAKSALGYSAPSLQETQKHRVGIQPVGGGGSSSGMGTGGLATASPAQIALSGTGGSGTAPTGPATGSLRERGGGSGGGGLVGRALLGVGHGGGGGVGTGLGEMPSAAQELDAQIANAGSAKSGNKPKKGFEIAGPLTNRHIVRKIIPQYPTWAEEQGIIGSVRVYFTVTPDGTVRSNIRITKTTGYPALDQLGVEALKQWQFAPLSAADEGKGEWGIITFNFSLSS